MTQKRRTDNTESPYLLAQHGHKTYNFLEMLSLVRCGEVNADDVAGGMLHGEPTAQILPLMPVSRTSLGCLGERCAEQSLFQDQGADVMLGIFDNQLLLGQ